MKALFLTVCLALLFLLLLAGGTACGGSSPTPTPAASPTPTPTPIPPDIIVREAGQVMRDLDTFRFHLTHQGGGTPIFAGILMQEALGDVAKPDRLRVELSGTLGQFFIKVELITVGDDAFLTNPLTGDWESLPQDVSPLAFFNPRQGIAAIMSQITEVALEGKETDRETPYIIIGNVPSEALKPLLGIVAEGEVVEVRLEIEAGSLRLLEARLSGVVSPGENPGIVRIIALSRFNQPVEIEPPT